MRVLFVGPSLYGETPDFTGIESPLAGAARAVYRAGPCWTGAGAIGLIDGYFDAVAAPWRGNPVRAGPRRNHARLVLDGRLAPPNARRSACARWARIALRLHQRRARRRCGGRDYPWPGRTGLSAGDRAAGQREADALERLRSLQLISETEQLRIWGGPTGSLQGSLDRNPAPQQERAEILAAYREHKINRKAEDALLLIAELKQCPETVGSSSAEPEITSFFSKHILPGMLDSAS